MRNRITPRQGGYQVGLAVIVREEDDCECTIETLRIKEKRRWLLITRSTFWCQSVSKLWSNFFKRKPSIKLRLATTVERTIVGSKMGGGSATGASSISHKFGNRPHTDFQVGQKHILYFVRVFGNGGDVYRYRTLILIVYPDCFVNKNVRYGTETDGAVWTC